MNDLMAYSDGEVTSGNILDIMEAHNLMPNFLKVRIPVHTQLNVVAWKYYLTNYWDKQLIDLITFGFPLDFDRSVTLNSTVVSHQSAVAHLDHVTRYIGKESEYGAL